MIMWVCTLTTIPPSPAIIPPIKGLSPLRVAKPLQESKFHPMNRMESLLPHAFPRAPQSTGKGLDPV